MNSFIKFSNKLTKHGTSYITYSGYLFQNNVDSVSIVYGFGKNWEHTEEKVMEKTDEGFVAKVEMFDDYDVITALKDQTVCGIITTSLITQIQY